MSPIIRGLKKVIIGISLAGCGAGVLAYVGVSEQRAIAKSSGLNDTYNTNSFVKSDHYRHYFPGHYQFKWDRNWDKRQPFGLLENLKDKIDEKVFTDSKVQEKNDKKLEKARVTASRHLILLRHGQYNLEGKTDQDRFLTTLGRQQASLAARRLRELNLPFRSITRSTMKRAQETGEIISKEFPDLPVSNCDLLREGWPCNYDDSSTGETKAYRDGPRIEAAFRRYFHRADSSQTSDSYEIIVCHANVIRYFLCRALQIQPEAWIRFTLHNCSLTWITILPNGKVHTYAVGDAGFMPPCSLTTS